DYPGGAGFFQHNTQIFLAVAFVRFAVFRRLVVTGNKMRSAAAGSLQHFALIELEKLLIPPRPPREGVHAIKSQNMIDTKEMKNASDRTDALAPRLEVVRAHSIPAIQGYDPVMSLLLQYSDA